MTVTRTGPETLRLQFDGPITQYATPVTGFEVLTEVGGWVTPLYVGGSPEAGTIDVADGGAGSDWRIETTMANYTGAGGEPIASGSGQIVG